MKHLHRPGKVTEPTVPKAQSGDTCSSTNHAVTVSLQEIFAKFGPLVSWQLKCVYQE